MKYIKLLFGLIAVSAALAGCSMDTSGGFYRGTTTMAGRDVYEPSFGL
jgi:hypothetical protein